MNGFNNTWRAPLLYVCLACLMHSCFLDDDENGNLIETPIPTNTLNFIFSYEKPINGFINFEFQDNQSSPFIQFEDNVSYTSNANSNGMVDFLLQDVHVFDPIEEENYEIIGVELFRQNEQNSFIKEEEFSLDFFNVSALDAVIIIDNSTSMDGVVDQMIGSVNTLISSLSLDFAELNLSKITFDPNLDIMPLGTSHSVISDSVSAMTLHSHSKLFDAVEAGIEMLETFNSGNDKAIFIFSDGKDNTSNTNNKAYNLQQQMKAKGIMSFVLGMRFGNNDLDQEVLELLSNNIGLLHIVNSAQSMRSNAEAATDFIGLSYNLIHTRIDSESPEPQYYDLRLSVR